MSEPADLDATEARRLIGAKALSPVELMESCLARIARLNPTLNAIVALDADAAMNGAKAAEQAVMDGRPLGRLHGLPTAIKDNRDVKGMVTSHGSLLYADNVAAEDEPGVARLRAEGAVVFAKTNLPEFAAGANTTNRLFGPTGNPFDPTKTSAGSSGGSAAALAVGMVPVATGSDYGGSLRTPASFCGITGFRPSMGLVPAPEMAAYLSPWGVNGPMGRTVADSVLLMSAQAGYDPRDPYSHAADGIEAAIPAADLSSVRLATSVDFDLAPVAKEIRGVFDARVGSLASAGLNVETATPDFGPAHEIFEITRGIAFLVAHHERVQKHRDQLDRNVIDNTERGLTFTTADVAWAQREQAALYRRFVAFFERYDALIAPAASVSPFPHSQLFVEEIDGEAMPTYMRWLALSYIPTMGFACAAAIPAGKDGHGMPFGLQVIGPRGADRKILAIAAAIEAQFAADPVTARPLPDLAALA
ncbi:hypothetical protein DLJ53_14920 [Acuticoccus sediminis]|uniref:Amidase domain-containing protein n=1 Tax=Acuticoccus sediminis TaxID=2184697 RepID=A0A8B2NTR0_9HYPH|nr:amidase family protein [Acuticoccus sediminis]RAI00553.1 hypothetical protein DLJ53_14920 [Acuticoccus sediminis]